MWDLGSPSMTTFKPQRNTAHIHDIAAWVADHRHNNEPWRGLHAATTCHFNHHPHGASISLNLGDHVTIVGHPVWLWPDSAGTIGTYVFPVCTYHSPPTTANLFSDDATTTTTTTVAFTTPFTTSSDYDTSPGSTALTTLVQTIATNDPAACTIGLALVSCFL